MLSSATSHEATHDNIVGHCSLHSPCCFQRSHTATGKGCATRSVRARLSPKRSARSIRVRLYSMSARQECSSYVRRICNSHLAQRLGQAIHLQHTSIRCEDALSLLLSRLFASSSTWLDLATPLHGDAEWYSSSVFSFQRLSTRSDTGLPIHISHR